MCGFSASALGAIASCADDERAIVLDASVERAIGSPDVVSFDGALDAAPPDADVVLPPLEAGSPCADASVGCGPGLACCVPCCLTGAPAVCTPIPTDAGGASCPLPNLHVDRDAMAESVIFQTIFAGPCELEEKCADDGGLRRVLRFDVMVVNDGVVDLTLGNPDASAAFEYAACHKHYHFSDFARYALLDDAGTAIVVGRKQAFCARDDRQYDPTASDAGKYDCEHQGISRGWGDLYSKFLPCQWLDITDVPPGKYTLEVEVNPSKRMTELRYDDNVVRAPVDVP